MCARLYSVVCVCVINTGVTDSIFLTAFASHEKKKEKIPTTAMPQRVSVHRLTSRQSVLDALIHQTYTHNNPPPLPCPPHSPHCSTFIVAMSSSTVGYKFLIQDKPSPDIKVSGQYLYLGGRRLAEIVGCCTCVCGVCASWEIIA